MKPEESMARYLEAYNKPLGGLVTMSKTKRIMGEVAHIVLAITLILITLLFFSLKGCIVNG